MQEALKSLAGRVGGSFQTRRQKSKAYREPRLLEDAREMLRKVDASGYRPTEAHVRERLLQLLSRSSSTSTAAAGAAGGTSPKQQQQQQQQQQNQPKDIK
eukprot:7027410-Pyramimonas_sp.AAC.1